MLLDWTIHPGETPSAAIALIAGLADQLERPVANRKRDSTRRSITCQIERGLSVNIRLTAIASALCLASLLVQPAFAQTSQVDPALLPVPPAQAVQGTGSSAGGKSAAGVERGSGLQRSFTYVSGHKFTGRTSSSAPMLSYDIWMRWTAVGQATPAGYMAVIDLEPGLRVDYVGCNVDDSSATNNVSGGLYEYVTDWGALGSTTVTTLATGATSGSTGPQWLNILGLSGTPFTTRYIDDSGDLVQHVIRVDIASDTSLGGCNIWWTRQISPAPISATFTDVPTGHWAYQYVEALKKSGVTTGATATTFNPNGTVSRAEMAVFLARGLGLAYPY